MLYVPDTEAVLQTNPLHSLEILFQNICGRIEDPQRPSSFQGGALSAYGTLLYIKEERINSTQSAVDDSIMLA